MLYAGLTRLVLPSPTSLSPGIYRFLIVLHKGLLGKEAGWVRRQELKSQRLSNSRPHPRPHKSARGLPARGTSLAFTPGGPAGLQPPDELTLLAAPSLTQVEGCVWAGRQDPESE